MRLASRGGCRRGSDARARQAGATAPAASGRAPAPGSSRRHTTGRDDLADGDTSPRCRAPSRRRSRELEVLGPMRLQTETPARSARWWHARLRGLRQRPRAPVRRRRRRALEGAGDHILHLLVAHRPRRSGPRFMGGARGAGRGTARAPLLHRRADHVQPSCDLLIAHASRHASPIRAAPTAAPTSGDRPTAPVSPLVDRRLGRRERTRDGHAGGIAMLRDGYGTNF